MILFVTGGFLAGLTLGIMLAAGRRHPRMWLILALGGGAAGCAVLGVLV